MCRRPVRRLDLQCFISHVSHSHVFSSLSSSSSSSQFLRTHEQETKAVFEKLHKYIGKNIRRLVEVPSSNDGGGVSTSSSSEESAFVFRLHRNRVYYVRAESGAECRRIAEDLNAFSRVARRHFELRSRWERARDRIKTAYESPWVQGLVGALILAVNARAFDRA